MSGCVFCDLPKKSNDRENLILKRSENAFVIMNKYPYNSGHLMVVPLQHTADLATLNDRALLDVQQLIRDSLKVLKGALGAHGFNVGMNLGEAGGAGIREHLHYHVVPRWNGDTNYMPVLTDTKVLPESLEATYDRLVTGFSR